MNEPLTVSALARSVWSDFRRAWGGLVIFEVLFKLLEAWVLVPAIAVVLSTVLSRAGHIAVSNWDILDFLLSPFGWLYAALASVVAVAFLLFEQAGIMVLAESSGSSRRPPISQLAQAALLKIKRVTQLGAVQVALLALASVPFVLLAILTYVFFLSQHDINHYLEDRPPAFLLASVIGTILLLAALTTGIVLYVQWAFALPIALFEKQDARASLRASRERVHKVFWRVGFLLLGWHLGALLLGLVLQAGLRLLAGAVLEKAGERPIALILLLLVIQGGLLAILSFVTVVGQGLLTRRLYLFRSEQLGRVHLAEPEPESAPGEGALASRWTRVILVLCLATILVAPMAVWAQFTRQLAGQRLVQVTAHRGHSRAAPENTLSAIRKAIESGADYAEIDVQQTADGVVVLLHDRDLMRVAGVPKRIGELYYDEVRKLDVGKWFNPSFAGERVPTLAEVITLSREGRIRLNIELKFEGPDEHLAPEVSHLVHEQDFEPDCLITSFSYDGLLQMKRQNPRLRTGLIVAQALGDVSRLEIDALSVRAESLSDEMLRAAHRNGREVHVWTVNDARQMDRLIKRGVDNIITDEPDVLVRVRDEWASLAGTERLLLASRLLLGLDR